MTSEQNTDWLAEMTVQNLLEHSCGGWPNDAIDPMYAKPELNHKDLIAWVLQNRPLNNAPGKVWSYSNFGYCLLERIIEEVSKQTYADFVQDMVLGKCGITTMAIAGNSEAERQPQEVVYYGQPHTREVTIHIPGLPDQIMVIPLYQDDYPYKIPVSRMDSHGGWIATAVDLVRFAVHVDGFPSPPDILNSTSINTMITPTTVLDNGGKNPHYAKGWFWYKDPDEHNWFHYGNLSGTFSFLVRGSDGFCLAALLNSCPADEPKREQMTGGLDELMWRIVRDRNSGKKFVSKWPTQDLFPTYDDPLSLFVYDLARSLASRAKGGAILLGKPI